MKSAWIAGILIAVCCGLWQLIMGFTGWYKDPVMQNLFWLIILIQFFCLIWGLTRTGKEGKRYWAQVGSGTLMSLLAGMILFFVAYLFTAVLFPNYFEEMVALQRSAFEKAGRTPEEIKFTMDIMARTAKPWVQGISAMTGTVVTGFVCSLLIAAFVRKRDQ